MLLLFFNGTQQVPASAAYVNLAQTLGDLWPALNAANEADAVWWTADDIYSYFNEAAERLARTFGVFVEIDRTLAAVQSQPNYNWPTGHLSTIQVMLAGTVLKARNVQEVEAFDDDWPATIGTPTAFMEDTQGTSKLTLYPIANAGAAGDEIGIVEHKLQPEVDADNAIFTAPQVLEEYFIAYALAEARAAETLGQQQESAKWFRAFCGLMEEAIKQYWGKAQ